MARRPARGFAALAVLGAGCAAIASCTSFSASGNDATDAGGADATTPVDGGSDAPAVDARVDDAADADGGVPALDCDGSTFCETFDTGDLPTIVQRWGLLDESAGCNACITAIVEEGAPLRRFLEAKTSTPTTYARLTHPLGATTNTTRLALRFDVRFSTKGSYEVAVVNLYNDNGVLSADLAVRATPTGALSIAWSTGGPYKESAATPVFADGAWHTAILEASSTGANLAIEGATTSVSGSPFQSAWPMARFSVGAYFADGTPPVIAIDDVRLDVSP